MRFSKYEYYNKLLGSVTLFRVTLDVIYIYDKTHNVNMYADY